MVKIWKYPIPGRCDGKVKQVLDVKMQYGKPVVWVLLDDKVEKETTLNFFTVGTGWELNERDEKIMDSATYIGTVKDEEGFIWHCFYSDALPEEIPENLPVPEDTNT